MGTPACHLGSEMGHVSDPFSVPVELGRGSKDYGATEGLADGLAAGAPTRMKVPSAIGSSAGSA